MTIEANVLHTLQKVLSTSTPRSCFYGAELRQFPPAPRADDGISPKSTATARGTSGSEDSDFIWKSLTLHASELFMKRRSCRSQLLWALPEKTPAAGPQLRHVMGGRNVLAGMESHWNQTPKGNVSTSVGLPCKSPWERWWPMQ
jgi:hypothetical protein